MLVEQYDDNYDHHVPQLDVYGVGAGAEDQHQQLQVEANEYLSLALGSPRYQKTCPRTSYSISARSHVHNQQSGLTMSIAEKPKSQEVVPFSNLPNSNAPCQMITESEMQRKADDNGMLSWQEGAAGFQSNLAVCPSNQFMACAINELSDQAQCHMNTFANTKHGK